jgi:hypothetical protein
MRAGKRLHRRRRDAGAQAHGRPLCARGPARPLARRRSAALKLQERWKDGSAEGGGEKVRVGPRPCLGVCVAMVDVAGADYLLSSFLIPATEEFGLPTRQAELA